MSFFDTAQNYVKQLQTSQGFSDYLSGDKDRQDAWVVLEETLDRYGLRDLVGNAQDWLVEGYSAPEVTQRLRATDTYKKRFAAIEERRKAGLPAISEGEVISAERAMAQVMQRAGLPPSFYDSPDDFSRLIARDVSPAEFEERVVQGYVAVRSDPRIQNELNRFYGAGLDDGDLVAFYLDPDKALTAIQRKQAAATIASKSKATGFGDLTQESAERLAGQGISGEQAQQGFGQLAEQRSLMNPLASEQGAVTHDEALAAVFENNADAQERLARRRQERTSKFAGGGGYQTNRTGATGAGSVNS